MKVKTPVGGADNNRNDSSTANCESTHAMQDVSTVLLYSRVCVISQSLRKWVASLVLSVG